MNLSKKVKALFNPEMYHGWGKTSNYFEGWYYKLISKDEQNAFAVIPGIAFGENNDSHAFIQVLDGKNEDAHYIKFDISEFKPSSSKFELQLGSNSFSYNHIELNLEILKGRVELSNTIPWPSTFYSPGIMGPFSFVPFMECYHGVLSMDHNLSGSLIYKNEEVSVEGGKGYLEKDWGHSFPSAYFWMQSNHFSEDGISLKASVAKIPWMGTSFVGFIAGLWVKGKLIQFTTYNGTRLKKSHADENHVVIIMENFKYRLEIKADRSAATELASPIGGLMDGRISESMTSTINVKVYDKKNKMVLLEDKGRNAGLEVAGKIDQIFIS